MFGGGGVRKGWIAYLLPIRRILNDSNGGSRISPRRGAPTPGGRQHTILPNFPKNCMKVKEFGPPRGDTRVPRVPLRSATGLSYSWIGGKECLQMVKLLKFRIKTCTKVEWCVILIRYRPNLLGGWWVILPYGRSRVHNGVGRFTYSGCSSPLPEIEVYCKCSSDACIDADAPNQSSTLSVDRPLLLISAARVGLGFQTLWLPSIITGRNEIGPR